MPDDDAGRGTRAVTPAPSRPAGRDAEAQPGSSAPGASTAEASPPRVKRNFNEAAHKLGHWPVRPAPVKDTEPSEAIKAAANDERDVVAHAGRLVLALGALGIVYGDLGTSPLYTMQVVFSQHANAAHPTPAGIYGIVSLIFWALMIIVSTKYAVVIMRAHNRGDGGIMALTALIQRRRVPRAATLATLGLLGAGLFFGDGMITPAISVTSAVGGLNVVDHSLSHLVVPISLAILIALFAVQRYGTGAVGWMFGPVILVFFTVIGVFGLLNVIPHPEVLQGLSPTWAVRFLVAHGVEAWLTLGAVVLCCTGAEALYADRGHFGATPIRMTWFGIVFPAVMLSYLGQAGYILDHPHSVVAPGFNPFFQLFPHALLVPVVVLATLATIIASQAALTGSFSVAKQAVQLGFLPRLRIVHTSELEGQIYVPVINWFLGLGVVTLVLAFQSSTRLSDIYGVAVTGTFILDTTLFVAVARSLWRTATWKLAVLATVFYVVEVSFFTSNLTKVTHGAWLPLLVGLAVATVMATWRRGRDILTRNRSVQEGSLEEFLDEVRTADPPMVRLPVTAIFLNPGKKTTPLALRAQVDHNHAFHQKVLIVSMDPVSIPRVDKKDRFVSEVLGKGLFKIVHLTIHVGYHDTWNVPAALAEARKRGLLDRNLDLEHASYFVSRMTIVPTDGPGLARWRKRLFITMARNATSPIDAFRLPSARTVMTGCQVGL
ncbi:MAG TPA: KUP/HAK/KT family potassium transporter [Solirubrobacteraceae bacterium]|jgi:KUP system potassium uptake protein|nr:KUP/HAK/KT family potassium transporter [Solirubrobacteraceae bacterium]